MGASGSTVASPEEGAPTTSFSQPLGDRCQDCQAKQPQPSLSESLISSAASECPINAGNGSGCPIMKSSDEVDPSNMVLYLLNVILILYFNDITFLTFPFSTRVKNQGLKFVNRSNNF